MAWAFSTARPSSLQIALSKQDDCSDAQTETFSETEFYYQQYLMSGEYKDVKCAKMTVRKHHIFIGISDDAMGKILSFLGNGEALVSQSPNEPFESVLRLRFFIDHEREN